MASQSLTPNQLKRILTYVRGEERLPIFDKLPEPERTICISDFAAEVAYGAQGRLHLAGLPPERAFYGAHQIIRRADKTIKNGTSYL